MDSYVGEIRMFSGSYAPENWHLCDGTLLSISNYEMLYSLLGTTWGGDGHTTFGLPDLRGRVPVGQGTGTNLTARVLGNTGGSETVTVTAAQLPAHSHSFNATSAPATTGTPGPSVIFGQASTGDDFYAGTEATPNAVTLDTRSIANTGGGQPHENCMSSVAISFIICLVGTYPMHP